MVCGQRIDRKLGLKAAKDKSVATDEGDEGVLVLAGGVPGDEGLQRLPVHPLELRLDLHHVDLAPRHHAPDQLVVLKSTTRLSHQFPKGEELLRLALVPMPFMER